jgi:hypothetical protein
MRNSVKVGIKRELSVTVVDEENGKIAGCFLNIDTAD